MHMVASMTRKQITYRCVKEMLTFCSNIAFILSYVCQETNNYSSSHENHSPHYWKVHQISDERSLFDYNVANHSLR